MKKKLTEDEKKELGKMLNRLKDDSFKKVNTDAQRIISDPPNVNREGLIGVLDWIEDYLLTLKNK